MKLGDDTIVLETVVDDWDNRDEFGNPAKTKTWREIRWCSFTPSRASEDFQRTGPAIVGGTLLAPIRSRDAVTGQVVNNAAAIQGADAFLTDPVGPDSQGRYTGRRWEILGEIGKWEESVEMQARRLL